MIMVFIDCDHSCLIYSASFEFDVLLEVFFFGSSLKLSRSLAFSCRGNDIRRFILWPAELDVQDIFNPDKIFF